MVLNNLTEKASLNLRDNIMLMNEISSNAHRFIGILPEESLNALEEIWSIAYLFDKGERLEVTKAGFIERYFFSNYHSIGGKVIANYEPKDGAREAICRKLSDICFVKVRESNSVSFTEISRYVTLPDSVMARYELARAGILSNESGTKGEIIPEEGIVTKLSQIANGIVYISEDEIAVIHNEKLKELERLISEYRHKILIVDLFHHDRCIICRKIPGAVHLVTYNDFSKWKDGKIKIGVASPKIWEDDIDFENSNAMLIWFSLPWSLRIYMGMNRKFTGSNINASVRVVSIVAKNTIDETIERVLLKKCDDVQGLFLEMNTHTNEPKQVVSGNNC